MMQAAEALNGEDYETALEHFLWAREHFDYAILDFGIARGFHRLERFAEAEEMYTRFLRHFAGCPDTDNLVETAEDYRTLAIREHASRLEASTSEPETTLIEEESTFNPGWVVLGGGAGLLIVGLIYDAANNHLLDDRQAADDSGDDNEFYRIQEDIEYVQVVEALLFGTGVAAALTGSVLLFVLGDDASELQPEVGWAPTRNGGSVTFSARF